MGLILDTMMLKTSALLNTSALPGPSNAHLFWGFCGFCLRSQSIEDKKDLNWGLQVSSHSTATRIHLNSKQSRCWICRGWMLSLRGPTLIGGTGRPIS